MTTQDVKQRHMDHSDQATPLFPSCEKIFHEREIFKKNKKQIKQNVAGKFTV
jgi:hypothetical protein